MKKYPKKINLPKPSASKHNFIVIGNTTFTINPSNAVNKVGANKSIDTLERALKNKVFSDLQKDEKCNK